MSPDIRRTSFKKPLTISEELFHGFDFDDDSSSNQLKKTVALQLSGVPHTAFTPEDRTLPVPKHNEFIRLRSKADHQQRTLLSAAIDIGPRKESLNMTTLLSADSMEISPESSSVHDMTQMNDSVSETSSVKIDETSKKNKQTSSRNTVRICSSHSNLVGKQKNLFNSSLTPVHAQSQNKGRDSKCSTSSFGKKLPPLPPSTMRDSSTYDYSHDLQAFVDSLNDRISNVSDDIRASKFSFIDTKQFFSELGDQSIISTDNTVCGPDKETNFVTKALVFNKKSDYSANNSNKSVPISKAEGETSKSQANISNSLSSLSSGLTHYSSKTQSSCRTSDSAGDYAHKDEEDLSATNFERSNLDETSLRSYGSIKSESSLMKDFSKRTSIHESTNHARIRRRYYLTRELVETERAFATDMSVVLNVYAKRLNNREFAGFVCKEDMEKLFSNAVEIFALSRQFVQTLRQVVNPYVFDCIRAKKNAPIEDVDIRVGEAFLPYLDEMGQAFETYCKQNESQMATFVKIKTLAPPAIDTWLWQCFQDSKDLTSAGTLDSLLIKPVQRLLKYPLLLGSLLNNTPENHKDYPALREAVDRLRQCTDRINAETGTDPIAEPIAGNSSVRSLKVIQSGASEKYLRLVENPSTDGWLEMKLKEFSDRKSHLEKLMSAFRDNAKAIQRHFDINARLAETWLDFFTLYDEDSTKKSSSSSSSRKKYKKYALSSSTFTSQAPSRSSLSAVKIAAKLEHGVLTPLAKIHAMYERTQAIIRDRKKFHACYAKYIASKKSVDRGNPNVYHTPSEPKRNSQQISAIEIQRADLFVKYHNHLVDGLDQLFEATENVIGLAMSKYVGVQKRWFRFAIDYMASVLDLRLEDIKDPQGESNPIMKQFLKEHVDMKKKLRSSGLREFSLGRSPV